jgi:hypothetical protein
LKFSFTLTARQTMALPVGGAAHHARDVAYGNAEVAAVAGLYSEVCGKPDVLANGAVD